MLLALVAAALGVTAVLIAWSHHPRTTNVGCTIAATSGSRRYLLSLEQAQNASLIAAVGSRLGVPDHAVTVAIATSLVESQLHNLSYGDRDSVGLFQQRPSQGWGTRTQLLDPNFAAAAFYRKLVAVPGWQTMAVTDAAQAVQHSAAPRSYADYESAARALAQALTGEVARGLACRLDGFGGAAPSPDALAAAATTEFGAPRLGVPLDGKSGWATAIWAVAHAYNYHVARVTFAGWRWSSTSDRWTVDSTRPSTVVVTTGP